LITDLLEKKILQKLKGFCAQIVTPTQNAIAERFFCGGGSPLTSALIQSLGNNLCGVHFREVY